MGFPTENDHFGLFWGYHHLRKHPNQRNQWVVPYFSYFFCNKKWSALEDFFHAQIGVLGTPQGQKYHKCTQRLGAYLCIQKQSWSFFSTIGMFPRNKNVLPWGTPIRWTNRVSVHSAVGIKMFRCLNHVFLTNIQPFLTSKNTRSIRFPITNSNSGLFSPSTRDDWGEKLWEKTWFWSCCHASFGNIFVPCIFVFIEGGKSSVPKFMGTKSKQAKIWKEFPPAIKPPRFNNHRRATQNPRRCLLLLRPKCLAPLYKKVLGLLKISKSFLKKRIRFSNKPFYLLEYSERQSILMEKTAKMPPYCFFGKS